MKRELWMGSLRKSHCAPWPCPHCGKGILAIDQKSLVYHETLLSKRSRQDEEFSPEWVDYRFVVWVECTNCKGRVIVTGTGGVDQVRTSEEDWDWEDFFTPQFWNPMPDIIELPDRCPDDVRESLQAAFALHAFQRAACATRLRVALEFLMDHENVPLKKKSKTGKYYNLSLHDRLTDYAKTSPEVGAQLMALKWLGNAGSHEAEVSRDDLLDAFEIFEHALAEIIGERNRRVAKLVKSLTKKFAKKKR